MQYQEMSYEELKERIEITRETIQDFLNDSIELFNMMQDWQRRLKERRRNRFQVEAFQDWDESEFSENNICEGNWVSD